MTRTRPPFWYWVAAALLFVWGLAGVFACVQQWRLGADAMGPADAYYRALYATLPGWYNVVYAVATGTGLIGAVALLVRSGVARALFVASLVAIVVQFGWLFARTDMVAVRGAAAVVPFPVFVAAVALLAILLAGHARRRGWIG